MAFLSVVVPVLSRPDLLDNCLASVRASDFSDYEIVVADDGCPPEAGIERIVRRHGASVVRGARTAGPAAARNSAARHTTGEILVFLDADVTVHGDTLGRIAQAFREDAGLDGILGSYDFEPRVAGTVAVFRNLLHAHVHHRSAGVATTFWAGCGALRKKRFLAAGGFDETYVRPSIEDVELGLRLHRAGCRLVLDPQIQVTHYKEWTLPSMVRTDALHRAMPWTVLMLSHGLPRNLGFRARDRVSVATASVFPVTAACAMVRGGWWIAAAAVPLLVLWLCQTALFRVLARERGAGFAAVCFPLYVAHALAASVGLGLGLCQWAGSTLRGAAVNPADQVQEPGD